MSVLLLRPAAVVDVEDAAVVVVETPEDPQHLRNHPECFSSRLTRHPSRRPRPLLLLQLAELAVVEVALRLQAALPQAVAEMPVVAVAVNVAVVAAVSLYL